MALLVDEDKLRMLLRGLINDIAYDHIIEKYDITIEFIDPIIEECRKNS